MRNYSGFGLRRCLQGMTLFVILCGCVGLVSCKHSDEKSIDLGDAGLEKAYLDYRKAMCSGDIEAFKRLVPKFDPKMTEEQYERFLQEWLLPELVRINGGEDYMKWFESAYIVRKEFFDDGRKVKLWLGPETEKKHAVGTAKSPARKAGEPQLPPDPSTIHKVRYHEQPVQFQKDGGRWMLYIG